MAFCSGCGTELAPTSATCPKCGKAQPAGLGGGAAAAPAVSADAGLAENLAGALSYLVIPAIIFLVLEPYNRNRTIRFHAFQGLFLALSSIVVQIILGMVPFIGWALLPFVSLAFFVVAVIAALKAFQNSRLTLPIISEQAEKMANQ